MDVVFFMLTCCLSFAFTEPTTENEQTILQNTSSTAPGQNIVVIVINSTNTSSINSSEHLTISTTLIANTALTSAVEDNTSTAITSTTTTSGHSQTSESMTTALPFTSKITQSTDITTATQTKTSVRHSDHSTSVSHSTSAAVTSANSQSVLSTQGVRLSLSERNLTITFSVILGIFVLAVVALKLHRCSQSLQFLHQPLNNTEELNVSTASSDTIISGGLYDSHPIYDHVPPARQDESDFHLEFLH